MQAKKLKLCHSKKNGSRDHLAENKPDSEIQISHILHSFFVSYIK